MKQLVLLLIAVLGVNSASAAAFPRPSTLLDISDFIVKQTHSYVIGKDKKQTTQYPTLKVKGKVATPIRVPKLTPDFKTSDNKLKVPNIKRDGIFIVSECIK